MSDENKPILILELERSGDNDYSRKLSRLEAYHDRLGDCVRNKKVSFFASGGNASKQSKAARITLPTKWVKDMGVTPDDRDVTLEYSNGVITIHKAKKENEEEN